MTTRQTDQVWQSVEVAHGYLEGMRGAIPLAAEQLDVMMRIIRAARPELTTFLDIGCGDGILGHTILAHYPDATGVLLDFSEPMIEAARRKLAPNRNQLQFITQDYGEPEWTASVQTYAPFDAIVSGFSIHHQPDDRKQSIYQEIFSLLKPGGVFINIEHVEPESHWIEERFNELFVDTLIAHNQRQGVDLTPEEVDRRFREREHKDANILAPLDSQLDWLREIGYQHVACYLKMFELAVFGGIRPE
ncbi:MAG: class I SAM-dependent methyltransferase [Chloroflexi bacterium]|nr:class I SAM-dependent methyltransferase [Chloroflexota bacterium]MCC6891769.1 class I SAM-dependent methyltransferase [Anaerolineae bacterium]